MSGAGSRRAQDVHKKEVVACPRVVARNKTTHEVRRFPTTTRGLIELAEWLEAARYAVAIMRPAALDPSADRANCRNPAFQPRHNLRQGKLAKQRRGVERQRCGAGIDMSARGIGTVGEWQGSAGLRNLAEPRRIYPFD